MASPSESEFRLAFLVDTFPRRTENFILREIDETARHWASVQVYCFKESPEDWAFIDPDLRPGLEGRRVASLSRSLGNAAFLHARTLARNPRRYREALRAAQSACRGSASRSSRSWRAFDRSVALASRLEADGITHLHAHFLSGPAIVAYLATRLHPIPYSLSAHAADVWSDPVCPEAIRSAAFCVACTRTAAGDLSRRYPRTRIETIHHGLSRTYLDRTASASRSPSAEGDLAELRILSAGRLVSKKGFDLLIGACVSLRGEGIGVRCRIFGDGPLREAIQREIDGAGLSSRVTLHPFVSHEELPREFGEAHLFALPCRIDPSTGDRDGIPNVLLEAMAAGTVVVSTDLPTIRELIAPNETGFLAPSDDAAGLAHAIRSAVSARAEWPRIREEARETLRQRFCLEDNQARFRRLLAEISPNVPPVDREARQRTYNGK